MKVGEKTLQNYVDTLIKTRRIKEFLNEKAPHKVSNGFRPILSVVDQVAKKNPSHYSGMALGSRTIQISYWICADKDQSFATVRHELAHCIQSWCELAGSYHGRGFTTALKLVSQGTWRNDRYWKSTPAVEQARQEINNMFRSVHD